MKVKIKRLKADAVIPSYAKPGDAGMDLVATSCDYDVATDSFIYGTGIAIEIPKGFVGLLFPRSSIYKTDGFMTNHVGVIDSGYRGEVKAIFKTRTPGFPMSAPYEVGNKIAQLMIVPYPNIEFEEVEVLSETERGEGGHGSTGK